MSGGITTTGRGVYKRKDGRWEARIYSYDGKHGYRSFYGETKEAALHKRVAAIAYSYAGDITEISVRELCREWLQIISNRVKPSTLANYRMKIEKHIIPQFGSLMCHEITSKALYDLINLKLSSGLSARYISDIFVLMKSLFKYARRVYHIPNPLDGIVIPKPARTEVRLLTPQEQERLKFYIGMDFSLISLGIILANGMGLRIGEVCGGLPVGSDLRKKALSEKINRESITNRCSPCLHYYSVR